MATLWVVPRGAVSVVVMVRWGPRFSCNRVLSSLTLLSCNSLYSSSRLVTLCLSEIALPSSDEFQWGKVSQRLVGADAIVSFLPAQ